MKPASLAAAASEAKWSKVEVVNCEVVGVIADKRVQITPVDADEAERP